MNVAIFWDIASCSPMWTDVSEERIVSITRVTKIGELGTTLAVTSNSSVPTGSYPISTGALSPGINRPERKSAHLSAASSEVNKRLMYTYTPS
jgi:hypothetical protein